MNKTKIILADDQELFRKGFRYLLETEEKDLEVVAEAANGQELLQAVLKSEADLVISDIQMPVKDGIEACSQLQQTHPHLPIIALSMFGNEHYIVDMIEAGAKGYLLKNTTRAEVRDAIKVVLAGGNYISAGTAFKISNLIAQCKAGSFEVKHKIQLSEREKQIVAFICQEYGSKEIAGFLNLSTRTVEHQRERIQEKIGCRNMAGIIVYAVKNNLC